MTVNGENRNERTELRGKEQTGTGEERKAVGILRGVLDPQEVAGGKDGAWWGWEGFSSPRKQSLGDQCFVSTLSCPSGFFISNLSHE